MHRTMSTGGRSPLTSRRVLGPALLAVALAVPSGLHADFSVFRAPSQILSLFALPGEAVPLDLATYAGTSPDRLERYQITAPDGVVVEPDGSRRFRLIAPSSPGIYPVVFQETPDPPLQSPRPYRIQLIVLIPADKAKDGVLNGYPVGAYPRGLVHEEWRYEPPRGFVEITEENAQTLISDHFRLADLDCKLDVPYPHYAVIRTSLLVKLEAVVDVLLSRGLRGDHLRVMSGFRTPQYNRSLGNQTTYSRHIAGDAADIYVDRNRDELMDDLNRDGRIDRSDARYLLTVVNDMDNSGAFGPLVGGASAYPAEDDHGPFVHIDTRGYPARW